MDNRAGPSYCNTNNKSEIMNPSNGRITSSDAEIRYPFESIMDCESSDEEESSPIISFSTNDIRNAGILGKTSDDKTVRSSETERHYQFENLISHDNSEDPINVDTGFLESTTNNTDIGTIIVPPQRQSSNGLSSTIDNEEIVLSVIYQNGHLGAAYYNTVTSELFILEDIAESNLNFNITNLVYRQSRPSFIITTSGMTDQFLTVIKKLILTENENFHGNETPSSNYNRFTRLRFKIMSKKEYSLSSCNTRVQHLKLETEPADLSDDDRLLFLNSIINFNRSIMIHALGLLLKYLDKHWNAMALDAVGQAKFIALHKLDLKDIVMIDNETLKGLQIINPRYHPSLFKFGNVKDCKEGLSLYSILNRCQSRPGAHCLWSMFQHPISNAKILNERLDVIEFCLDAKNQNVIQNMIPCLSKIHQITKVMNRLSAPQAKASEWQRLHKTLCNIIYIVDICEARKDALPIFKRIVDGTTDEMHRLKYFIEYIVDFESSRQQNKFVAKPGVDPQLDELNHQNQTLPQVLSLMAERELQDLPESVKACSMVYLPDIGYLLAITKWEGTPPLDGELPGLEFKFIANNIAHYKSPAANELQNTFGDILEKITKRQSQIMLQLVLYISKHIKPVLEIIKHIAQLDALISLSLVARDLNYVRPKISECKIIDIKQGRHPLLEVINTSFIANDTLSSDEESLVKIITGPNASGKSIYLKQVALIVFMAHIGSYVPADSATIGIVTHILSRIHFADTMALNASSFMIDLRQMNKAVSDATPNSLIVIDEFGKGTSNIDALSLLAAYLTAFINRGTADCPHILISTHLHDLVNFIPQIPIVEKQTFEFLINNDNETVVFLHRIISGNSGTSFAHSVASTAACLDRKIVQRALLIYENRKSNKPNARISTLNVCHREKLCRKVCEHLIEETQNIDMDGLRSCLTQMWIKNFGNKTIESSDHITTS